VRYHGRKGAYDRSFTLGKGKGESRRINSCRYGKISIRVTIKVIAIIGERQKEGNQRRGKEGEKKKGEEKPIRGDNSIQDRGGDGRRREEERDEERTRTEKEGTCREKFENGTEGQGGGKRR